MNPNNPDPNDPALPAGPGDMEDKIRTGPLPFDDKPQTPAVPELNTDKLAGGPSISSKDLLASLPPLPGDTTPETPPPPPAVDRPDLPDIDEVKAFEAKASTGDESDSPPMASGVEGVKREETKTEEITTDAGTEVKKEEIKLESGKKKSKTGKVIAAVVALLFLVIGGGFAIVGGRNYLETGRFDIRQRAGGVPGQYWLLSDTFPFCDAGGCACDAVATSWCRDIMEDQNATCYVVQQHCDSNSQSPCTQNATTPPGDPSSIQGSAASFNKTCGTEQIDVGCRSSSGVRTVGYTWKYHPNSCTGTQPTTTTTQGSGVCQQGMECIPSQYWQQGGDQDGQYDNCGEVGRSGGPGEGSSCGGGGFCCAGLGAAAPTPTPALRACGQSCTTTADCAGSATSGVEVVCRNNICENLTCPAGKTVPGANCACGVDTRTCGQTCGPDVGLCDGVNGTGSMCMFTTGAICGQQGNTGGKSHCIGVVNFSPANPAYSRGFCTGADTGNNYLIGPGGKTTGWTQAEINATCQFCGDGILQAGEACDEGANNGALTATCDTSCQPKTAVTPVPASCNAGCTNDSQCTSGLTCSNGACRNPSCTGEASCVCPTATVTEAPGMCVATKVYILVGDTWTAATPSQVNDQVNVGDQIRLATSGSGRTFNQARFRIRNTASGAAFGDWVTSTVKNTANEYYITYTIPAGGTFEVQAQVQ